MKEIELNDPYITPYRGIYAICDSKNEYAEIIEHTNCYGGAAWSKFHYSHSPLILNTRSIGNMIRYKVKTGKSPLELKPSTAAAGIESVIVEGDEVHITYAGLGGGGVGATKCRAFAEGVLRCNYTESGGGRAAKGTIVVPRRERVLIGIDDTDTKEEGATWTLTHNMAKALDCNESIYLSHSLVQLFPVSARTQNCVSTVLEFGCVSENAKQELLESVKAALLKYSVSDETGMVVLSEFEAKKINEYSTKCRSGELTKEYALEYAKDKNVDVWLDGNGVIGALAALAWFAQPDDSVKLKAQIE
ncbi:tRNA(Ile2) 2-agmatinylcytidine synthetase [Methanolobus tindarius DSM 2278]|jgi:methanogenesis imperfect marker protein 11|uniref:tRNA(Ile2) 2-agmatinylcytidine synthetase n=1 Tax=Methanolobus tindarius DSM 2278 TaxID=1090322 RepID=W9DPG3_METTI|nr:methanogenesis marker protein 11 [Methanolobus tindarius]ETA67103.1 tRNA(Ile2) 2-agmatinylcytidine synthetase [Methanolobus tindarius DSM 2278]